MPSLRLSLDMIKIMLAFRDCEQSRRIKQHQKAKIASSILITHEEYMKDISKIIHAFSSCANHHEKNRLMKYSVMHSQEKTLLPITESSNKESFKLDHRNVVMGLNNQKSETFFDENTFITYRTESSGGFRKGKRSISTIPKDDDVQTPPDVHNGHSIKMKRRKFLSQKEQEDVKLLLSLSDRM